MSDTLISAENYWRDGNFKQCFLSYVNVAKKFELLNDFETASYFHKKCLDMSIDFKYVEGEAKAYMGLGICEEKVLNIF